MAASVEHLELRWYILRGPNSEIRRTFRRITEQLLPHLGMLKSLSFLEDGDSFRTEIWGLPEVPLLPNLQTIQKPRLSNDSLDEVYLRHLESFLLQPQLTSLHLAACIMPFSYAQEINARLYLPTLVRHNLEPSFLESSKT